MEVHRCRFVEYQPAAINALDFTPPTVSPPRLAVGRANGNIEIWDPSHRYRLEKTIPGGKDLSVESLVWAHQSILTDIDPEDTPAEIEENLKRLHSEPPRLFSSGLNPYIIEWNTVSMTVKKSVDSNGGAVWCLAVNSTGTRLAAGCEDGCIRLFDISDGQLEFIRSFEPVKGRILSVAWGPKDAFIVSGGSDSTVRKWNTMTGRTTHRMTVNEEQKEPTLVWAVAALNDGTLVSGDSLGHLMLWNGQNGTLDQSFRSHGADILAIAVARDNSMIFSAGVDCKLTVYRPSPTGKGGRAWVNAASRRYHYHDIRALALDERPFVNSIVSGGVDLELVATPAREYPNRVQNRLPPFAYKYICAMSKSHRLILATFSNSVSVWRLGRGDNLDYHSSKAITAGETVEPHQLLLSLQLNPDCNITSSSLSENAKWIAVADIESVRLFRLYESSDVTGLITVKKDRKFEQALVQYLEQHSAANGAHHVMFTPGSDKLIIVTAESRILVVDLLHAEDGVFDVVREFNHHRGIDGEGELMEDALVATVTTIAVSSDGQWLATGDDNNSIHVFNLDSLKHCMELPRSFDNPHTALSFNDFRPNELFVGQASNSFYIYNVEQKQLTPWSKANHDFSYSKISAMRDRIRGVAYNAKDENSFIIYGSSFLCRIDTHDTTDDTLPYKAPKRKLDDTVERGDKREGFRKGRGKGKKQAAIKMKVSNAYSQILYCGFIENNTMVMVERPKFSVLENLPPSFYKANFGT